jgi:diguanylate cyclase (GGDEF)-like protein
VSERVVRLLSCLKGWHGQHDLVNEQALRDNLARLPWVLLGLLPLFGAGVALTWGNSPSVNAVTRMVVELVGWIDLGMLVWLGLLLALMWFTQFHHRLGWFSRALPLLLAANFLAFGVVLSNLSQWILPSATMYVLSCVFVGGLLLIRPSRIVPLYALSYAVFYVVVGTQDAPWEGQVVMRFHGGIAAALGQCLSLVLWRRHTVTELLRRQVQVQSRAMEAQNTELEWQKSQLEQLAQIDALSGLFNRRAFEVQGDLVLHRARRDGAGVAAVMFDLDFFKRVNDQYGHPAGDRVIKFMADTLRSSVRDTDVLARVGGEEFMLLLPGGSAQTAYEVAEKIRCVLLQTPVLVTCDKAVFMTVSAGVVAFDAGQIASFDSLYSAADQALYLAKRQGRNRVEVGACP